MIICFPWESLHFKSTRLNFLFSASWLLSLSKIFSITIVSFNRLEINASSTSKLALLRSIYFIAQSNRTSFFIAIIFHSSPLFLQLYFTIDGVIILPHLCSPATILPLLPTLVKLCSFLTPPVSFVCILDQ